MDGQLLEWANLLLRFLHVITAIAWIGASLYFIWLDLSLEPPSDEKLRRGLAGELWAIHGGGIYEVGKYRLSPPELPTTLHWFKWEAYSTWLTGSALLVAVYYLRADSQLVGAWTGAPGTAVLASVGFLIGGLGLYEAFMRALPRAGSIAQMLGLLTLLTGSSWLAFELFAPRAAAVHVGAMLGTIMAANVFLGIIPSQKSLVAAIGAGIAPDPELAVRAKQRSTHNNYLTLPVLFCMLSTHAPVVFGHPHAWLVVVAVSMVAMLARHFFNAKHAGRLEPAYLICAAVGFVVIAVAAGLTMAPSAPASGPVSAESVRPIVTAHCSGCHARAPRQPGFAAAPGGYLFESPADVRAQADKVIVSVQSGYMPLGNVTAMTDAERSILLAWARRGEDG